MGGLLRGLRPQLARDTMNGPSASPAFMERMVSFYSLLPFVHYHLRTQGALFLSGSARRSLSVPDFASPTL